ncbi:MAG: hypothetical protein IJW51_00150 [Clostridia bacterium]|nr:hypothetical protein [Clostridia bacterium]
MPDVFFPRVVGNEALRRRIGREFSEHSFSHAYILEGPRGFGKHLLARELAMAAACENRQSAQHTLPCGTCKFCRKIAADNCPDIITVKREEDRATMSVDVIRAMRAGIATVPNDLDIKVYIIEDAHRMTKQAQNALLLTLEEPPPFVLFLLLTEDARALLETVRSRAPILRLQPIEREAMRTYLLKDPKAVAAGAPALLCERPEEFEAILSLSGGAIGRALELLAPEARRPHMTQREHATRILQLLASNKEPDQLLLLVQSLGTARETVTAELTTLSLALRDLVLLTRTDRAPLLFYTDREAAGEIAAHFTTAHLLELLLATEAAVKALAANANVKLTLTHLLSKLLGAND